MFKVAVDGVVEDPEAVTAAVVICVVAVVDEEWPTILAPCCGVGFPDVEGAEELMR